MKTYLSVSIGALLIIGVGAFVFMQHNDTPQAPVETPAVQDAAPSETAQPQSSSSEGASTPTATAPAPAPAPKVSGISAAEVASHNSRESCWSTINGNVYDLTSWIPKHPGGEGAILGLCGKDGSSKYNRQHGGDARKLTILSGFKIGVAAQ